MLHLGNKRLASLFVAFAPVIVALCGLAGTIQLTRTLVRRERMQWQQLTSAEAVHIARQLQTGIPERFDALRRVGAWWRSQGRPLNPDDWRTDMRLFLDPGSGLQRVTWMDVAGKTSWSAGRDALPDWQNADAVPAEIQEVAAAARRTKSFALSRMIDKPGGSRVFYACVPILVQGAISGYVTGLYDATELFESVLQHQIPKDYSVSIIADGREFHLLKRPDDQWQGIEHTSAASVAGASWLVRVRAASSDLRGLRRLTIGFGVAVTALLSLATLLGGIAHRRAIALKAEIREHKAAEDKIAVLNRDLQRQLHDFRTLLEVTPVGIAFSDDPDCRSIWVNPAMAEMIGVPYSQNISKSGPDADKLPFKVLRHGQELPPEELPMQRAARTGRAIVGEEIDVVCADGKIRNTLVYTAPLFDESQRVRGVLHASIDMTGTKRAEHDRKSLQQKLLRAEKFKSLAVMAGGLAHDFNNLLTSIIGNASLALEQTPPHSHARALLLESLAASNQAARLVQQLLRYTGRTIHTRTSVNLSRVIEDMREKLEEGLPPFIRLRYDLSDDLRPIRAGVKEIQHALSHLISNAREAIGDEPGSILVSTGNCDLSEETILAEYSDQDLRPGHYVQVVIADTGCGMVPEIVAKAFDPFFTTKFLGRGLGLSEVQGVLRAYGGAVRVESGEATGSKFVLLFPALDPAGS